MKAFKNSNMFNSNHGPGGGSGGGGFHGPGGGTNSNFQNSQATKVVITSNLARVVSNSNNNSRVDTTAIQSSRIVDNIMCLPPVCANETRSFIRGL